MPAAGAGRHETPVAVEEAPLPCGRERGPAAEAQHAMQQAREEAAQHEMPAAAAARHGRPVAEEEEEPAKS